ncbi:hypothetical protein [Mesorhizobium delmotii]|uniref:Uncharacterized protein n=1 Tax=Mesorhizobium delmotii TaxID=1631247 RepID=A0A2P9AQ74_9HYPH|nr:hypothetical protein [Mesorhizobium delmotii]SJM33311.1 conserved hypothetical protein [Mesorhizobium delmotii]
MTLIVLHDENRYVGGAKISDDELRDRIERLLATDTLIREDDEPIRKTNALYEAEVQPGVMLWQLLFEPENQRLSRDINFQLQLAVDQSTVVAEDEVIQATVVGALGPFASSDHYVVDSESDWRSAVREDLHLAPGASAEFHQRCSKAFPRLHLSASFPKCLDTFDGGLQRYARLIVRCFSELNDEWTLPPGADLPEQLRSFSISSGFDTTLEGNGDRKPALSFKFAVDDTRSEIVLCEPHMKISGCDDEGDHTFRHHRIYFAPRSHDSFGNHVLVGHAGKHL